MALIKLVNSNLKWVIFDTSQITDINDVNGVCVVELSNGRQHILNEPYHQVVGHIKSGACYLREKNYDL